jgi:hypothetical protein
MPDTPRTIFYHREKPPCKDCPDRHKGCHSKCEKFIEWSKKTQDSRIQAINHYKADRQGEDYEIFKKIRLGKRYGKK